MIDICGQVAESLSAFFEGEAAGPSGVGLDRASVEAHLRVCTYCGSLPTGRQASPLPSKIWDGIESVLRADGLIRD